METWIITNSGEAINTGYIVALLIRPRSTDAGDVYDVVAKFDSANGSEPVIVSGGLPDHESASLEVASLIDHIYREAERPVKVEPTGVMHYTIERNDRDGS